MSKQTQPKVAMLTHGPDWCHLCGKRQKFLADVWYPDNAEHDPPVNPGQPHSGRHYVRVCDECGTRIATVATSGDRQ